MEGIGLLLGVQYHEMSTAVNVRYLTRYTCCSQCQVPH